MIILLYYKDEKYFIKSTLTKVKNVVRKTI